MSDANNTSPENGRHKSDAEPPDPPLSLVCLDPQDSEAPCPICDGKGVLLLDVPLGDPRYGKFQRCPNNPVESDTAMQERLRRFGNLAAYREYRFDNFHINIAGSGYSDAAKASLKNAKSAGESYAAEPQGWLVYEGPFGCGKTHLAVAIANARLEGAGEQVMFITAPDLLDLLRMSIGGENDASFDAYFERIRNIPLLALDDLGVENPSDWAREKLFQLLNHRHVTGLPTIITTNTPLEELDPRVGSRMMQRGLVQRVRIDAPDYRRQSLSNADEPAFNNLRLYDGMRFDTFDTDSLYRDERENLGRALKLAREWAADPQGWLCFIGDYGSGKTHLAAAIAYDLYERGQEVTFSGVPDLLDYFRVSFDGRTRDGFYERFDAIVKAPFLILDDLSLASATPWAKEKLFQIIDRRYHGRMPTVLTSYHTMEEIDARLTTRLMDHRVCTAFALIARSYVARQPQARTRR